MDLNGDGHLDMLSGSYSRMADEMAGLFQVLWGQADGKFKAAQVLQGTDGKPLLITAVTSSEDPDLDRICTRPTAVDLDGDGHLDLVSGNFGGTFALFRGLGQGKFEPKNSWLMHNKKRLQSDAHSDPSFADWDRDGDIDMICGGADGGVYLFRNRGTKTAPKFGPRETLLTRPTRSSSSLVFGDAHVKGPQRATRVDVADINGDGKFDILIGDSVDLNYPAKGLSEKSARAGIAAWNKESMKLNKLMEASANAEEMDEKMEKAFTAHWKKREKIVRTESTGFVWVLYGR